MAFLDPSRVNVLAAGLAIAGLLSACTPPAPYVHNPDEFNREDKAFNKEITERDSVTICYSKRNASPEKVRTLAEKACSDVGLHAVFLENSLLECPATTPAGAVFECVGAPGPRSGAKYPAYNPVRGGKRPYAWSYSPQPSPLESLLPPRP